MKISEVRKIIVKAAWEINYQDTVTIVKKSLKDGIISLSCNIVYNIDQEFFPKPIKTANFLIEIKIGNNHIISKKVLTNIGPMCYSIPSELIILNNILRIITEKACAAEVVINQIPDIISVDQ